VSGASATVLCSPLLSSLLPPLPGITPPMQVHWLCRPCFCPVCPAWRARWCVPRLDNSDLTAWTKTAGAWATADVVVTTWATTPSLSSGTPMPLGGLASPARGDVARTPTGSPINPPGTDPAVASTKGFQIVRCVWRQRWALGGGASWGDDAGGGVPVCVALRLPARAHSSYGGPPLEAGQVCTWPGGFFSCEAVPCSAAVCEGGVN
jgi:hypothetical protein